MHSRNLSRRSSPIGIAAIAAASAIWLPGCGRPDADQSAGDNKTISFFIDGPADFVSLSHSGAAPIKPVPAHIRPLQPARNGNSLGLTATLRDASGEVVGLASELEDFPIADTFDSATVWDTYWTVVINGRGSLLLHEKESLGPDLGRIFGETLQGTQDWTGNFVHASNVGPSPDGYGVIVGGAGEFAGATGFFEEIGTLRRFTPEGDLDASIELRVRYAKTP